MERFFILDKKNTWYDWKLILTDKAVLPPTPNTKYVKIDGMSGSLDLSEALTGQVTYGDRTVTASFWTDEGNRTYRTNLIQQITSALHGRKIQIIEPDDPEHYFYGRVKIKSVKRELEYITISIEATCEPWRYAVNESMRTVTVSEESVNTIIHNNGVKTLCPVISVKGDINITYNDNKISLTTGDYKISDIKLYQGVNIIGVSGKGSVTFTYREADL